MRALVTSAAAAGVLAAAAPAFATVGDPPDKSAPVRKIKCGDGPSGQRCKIIVKAPDPAPPTP